jgi:hypothetical protein
LCCLSVAIPSPSSQASSFCPFFFTFCFF